MVIVALTSLRIAGLYVASRGRHTRYKVTEVQTCALLLVPPSPGITSALGCLLVDVRHDLSAMFLAHLDSVDPQRLEEEFDRLERDARERLAAEDVPEEQMSIQRLVDIRHLRQWPGAPGGASRPGPLLGAAQP